MTREVLVKALNAALGLNLADFEEAKQFLQSAEGSQMLDTWLASHPDGTGGTTGSVTKFTIRAVAGCASAETRQPGRSPNRRTTR
ncbi:MAG TPA: hypothetical protein VHZ03_14600 [Trebonia sp.]|nr:hypothetical protein [Trebonia sp.]